MTLTVTLVPVVYFLMSVNPGRVRIQPILSTAHLFTVRPTAAPCQESFAIFPHSPSPADRLFVRAVSSVFLPYNYSEAADWRAGLAAGNVGRCVFEDMVLIRL